MTVAAVTTATSPVVPVPASAPPAIFTTTAFSFTIPVAIAISVLAATSLFVLVALVLTIFGPRSGASPFFISAPTTGAAPESETKNMRTAL